MDVAAQSTSTGGNFQLDANIAPLAAFTTGGAFQAAGYSNPLNVGSADGGAFQIEHDWTFAAAVPPTTTTSGGGGGGGGGGTAACKDSKDNDADGL